MDGFTATREIRRIEHERCSAQSSSNPITAYIIALTGLASDRDEDEAFAAGVDRFVTKPVQFDKLSKLLKQQEAGNSLSGQGQSS
jgi:CheY-like chemotaxis protein